MVIGKEVYYRELFGQERVEDVRLVKCQFCPALIPEDQVLCETCEVEVYRMVSEE